MKWSSTSQRNRYILKLAHLSKWILVDCSYYLHGLNSVQSNTDAVYSSFTLLCTWPMRQRPWSDKHIATQPMATQVSKCGTVPMLVKQLFITLSIYFREAQPPTSMITMQPNRHFAVIGFLILASIYRTVLVVTWKCLKNPWNMLTFA